MYDIKQNYTQTQVCRWDSTQDRDQWQELVNNVKNL